MYKIHLAPEARHDLVEIKRYISEELSSPAAAVNTLSRITKHLRVLTDFPQSGAPLSARYGDAGDYRFLVCGSYLAFYRVESDDVFIDRIMYGRRDYIRIIFGELPE